MHPSTVVRRTDAGSAELATPAHGLSLAQRRFLTLLDTACSLEQLAPRHPAEADKFERDLARLATLGLVACDAQPANDAIGVAPANEPIDDGPPTAVRLGAPRPALRIGLIVVAIVVAALAWGAWEHRRAPETNVAGANDAAKAAHAPATGTVDRPPADPQPIATRVLKSDPVERSRDVAKEARTPKGTEPRVDNATVKSSRSLPVEHRSPPPDEMIDAPVPSVARASVPSMTGAPVAPAMVAPVPPVTPVPAAVPAPVPAAASAPGPTTSVAAPAASTPASATSVTGSAASDALPVHVASAAPPAGLLRPTPLAALVPIARESPSFPREAVALGLANGIVKARLTIDAKGNVSNVDIVEASHRAFNRAVRDALARWRFEPGAAGRTTMVDVAFKRD